MTRFAPRLLVLLSASALAGCTMLGGEPELKEKLGVTEKPQTAKNFANDIDGNVRQAQLLRLAGKHDEAIQILSQLTLIAADDARVVGEYGKALVQRGRAQDATQFLRRAIDLSPNDWTLYSALGVAYDQSADQTNARAAYERALSLRPGEASVLNNYALSRMLAKDPEGARGLIAQAKAAGEPGDEKIARNVTMINEMAPLPVVAEAPKQTEVASSTSKALAASTPVTVRPQVARVNPPIPVVQTPPVAAPVASNAPRSLVPADQFLAAPPEVNQAAIVLPQQQAAIDLPPLQERRVVMQAVPFDPLAGPVKARPKPKAVATKNTAPVKQAQVPTLRVTNEQY